MRVFPPVLALLMCSTVVAEASTEAEAAFNQAMGHYKVGRFKEALAGYTQAYELTPHSAFLFNIAQCHRNLEQYNDAIFFYRRYLEETPGAQNRAAVEKLISDIETILEERTIVVTEPVHKKWWFWTILGVAVVAVAGGIAGGVIASDNVPDGGDRFGPFN